MKEVDGKPIPYNQPEDATSGKKQTSKLAKDKNILRGIEQHEEERTSLSNPFGKAYRKTNLQVKASLDTKNLPNNVMIDSEPKRSSTVNKQAQRDSQKRSTKQTFNQRLNQNIIKDQEQPSPAPTTKQSFRIKKVTDGRSPKKMRDDLVDLNQEEFKLQKQIVELHKLYKKDIDKVIDSYHIAMRNLSSIIPSQSSPSESRVSQLSLEETIQKMTDLLKDKKKHFSKQEKKISDNAFNQYLLTRPVTASIQEISSDEEDDLVEELPDRPRIENNIGSYSTSMAGIKSKTYGLNMRRTYDVFKENEEQKAETNLPSTHSGGEGKGREDISIKEGDNKMTLNQKFKDFLLS